HDLWDVFIEAAMSVTRRIHGGDIGRRKREAWSLDVKISAAAGQRRRLAIVGNIGDCIDAVAAIHQRRRDAVEQIHRSNRRGGRRRCAHRVPPVRAGVAAVLAAEPAAAGLATMRTEMLPSGVSGPSGTICSGTFPCRSVAHSCALPGIATTPERRQPVMLATPTVI